MDKDKKCRQAIIKSHVKRFIEKFYGKLSEVPLQFTNEFGQDLYETAALDLELSGKALELYDELEVEAILFERIFLRAMMFWTISRIQLGFTAKESIEAFLAHCEIPETLYSFENALRQYQRHKPKAA